jgi:hypothetical protein
VTIVGGIMMKEPLTITLNIDNSLSDNMFIVGLMNYIDDTLGLDYEQMRHQLDYVKLYLIKKQYEVQGTPMQSRPITEEK